VRDTNDEYTNSIAFPLNHNRTNTQPRKFDTYSPNDTITIKDKDISLVQNLGSWVAQFQNIGAELGGRCH
jgi:hypothetical protein